MYLPADDGKTHVNVYSQGKTELGRKLSNFARTPFVVPEHGAFDSVEGYWYWLSCHDDRLRKASGFAAKKLGRALRSPDWPETPDFKDRIRVALRAKLDAHPEIREALKANTLPLAHYYVFGNMVRNEQHKGQWILDALLEAAQS